MRESTYTQAVHKKLPKDIYRWKIHDTYEGGVPDAFYRSRKKEGRPLWVEYKYLKKTPSRGTTVIKPNLSQQQLNWLIGARNAGEQAWVIIGCEDIKVGRNHAAVILRDINEWSAGITTEEFLIRTVGTDYQAVADSIVRAVSQDSSVEG